MDRRRARRGRRCARCCGCSRSRSTTAGRCSRSRVPGHAPVADVGVGSSRSAHFAERFQLFVILALGESIVVTGATAAGDGPRRRAAGRVLDRLPRHGGDVVAVLRLRRGDRAAPAGRVGRRTSASRRDGARPSRAAHPDARTSWHRSPASSRRPPLGDDRCGDSVPAPPATVPARAPAVIRRSVGAPAPAPIVSSRLAARLRSCRGWRTGRRTLGAGKRLVRGALAAPVAPSAAPPATWTSGACALACEPARARIRRRREPRPSRSASPGGRGAEPRGRERALADAGLAAALGAPVASGDSASAAPVRGARRSRDPSVNCALGEFWRTAPDTGSG